MHHPHALCLPYCDSPKGVACVASPRRVMSCTSTQQQCRRVGLPPIPTPDTLHVCPATSSTPPGRRICSTLDDNPVTRERGNRNMGLSHVLFPCAGKGNAPHMSSLIIPEGPHRPTRCAPPAAGVTFMGPPFISSCIVSPHQCEDSPAPERTGRNLRWVLPLQQATLHDAGSWRDPIHPQRVSQTVQSYLKPTASHCAEQALTPQQDATAPSELSSTLRGKHFIALIRCAPRTRGDRSRP